MFRFGTTLKFKFSKLVLLQATEYNEGRAGKITEVNGLLLKSISWRKELLVKFKPVKFFIRTIHSLKLCITS